LRVILGGLAASVGLPRGLAGADGGLDGLDVLVGDMADLPPGAVTAAKYRGMPILLLNVKGEPKVLSALCTHEACTVTWEADRKRIVCPCHGGQYDQEGKVLEGPPPAPLIQLPVRVEDGKIYVVE